MSHDLQGNRFLELLAANPIEVYLLNTGTVGGPGRTSARARCASRTPRRS